MKRTHSLFLSLLTLTLTLTIFPNAAALAQTAAPNEAPAKAQPTAGATAGAGASTAAAASAAAVADAVAVAVRVDIAQPTGARIHRELFGTAFIANAKRVHEPLVRRQLAALGVPVTSVSVGWIGHVRKSADGPADWRELDTMLVGLREMGLGTEATPLQFAVGGPGKWFDVKNERHRQIWADTLAEAARHCAKARVRVAWWELWNEPDG
ncbi:MAG: hypothetical protein LBT53_08720, partial [Puniceicoccales bacterium]|nr:hypothetical protein [Puniceicoccales bacterium]